MCILHVIAVIMLFSLTACASYGTSGKPWTPVEGEPLQSYKEFPHEGRNAFAHVGYLSAEGDFLLYIVVERCSHAANGIQRVAVSTFVHDSDIGHFIDCDGVTTTKSGFAWQRIVGEPPQKLLEWFTLKKSRTLCNHYGLDIIRGHFY